MSGLLNGENQWEVVQHFDKPVQSKMLDALMNGANALSLNLHNNLNSKEIKNLFTDIDTDLIHLYIEGTENNIKEVLNLKVDATLPLALKNLSSSSTISYLAFEFKNEDFLKEALECLEAWKRYFENTDQLDHTLVVSFSMGDAYIDNICKIRAIRILWNLILKSFEIDQIPLKILAKQKDYNRSKSLEENFIKASLHLTAAAIASADAILLKEPNSTSKNEDFRARITRNIHHLAAEEGNLDLVGDPLKGSYVIEEKTNELAKEAWNKFLQ